MNRRLRGKWCEDRTNSMYNHYILFPIFRQIIRDRKFTK